MDGIDVTEAISEPRLAAQKVANRKQISPVTPQLASTLWTHACLDINKNGK
jgi:hypothetical protein